MGEKLSFVIHMTSSYSTKMVKAKDPLRDTIIKKVSG